jgi:hypothetical protein
MITVRERVKKNRKREKRLKKILVITFVIILALGTLAGCGGKTVGDQGTDSGASATVVDGRINLRTAVV